MLNTKAKAEPQAVSVYEAAERCGVSHWTLRRMIAARRLPAAHFGRILRVRLADLDALFTRAEPPRKA